MACINIDKCLIEEDTAMEIDIENIIYSIIVEQIKKELEKGDKSA